MAAANALTQPPPLQLGGLSPLPQPSPGRQLLAGLQRVQLTYIK